MKKVYTYILGGPNILKGKLVSQSNYQDRKGSEDTNRGQRGLGIKIIQKKDRGSQSVTRDLVRPRRDPRTFHKKAEEARREKKGPSFK